MNTDLLDRYIATWNERDADKRRAMVDELWANEGTYTDPLADVQGREAVDATIAAVQAQFPDFVFRPGEVFDAHHDIARFTWELGPAGGEAVVVGFDVAVLDENARIRAIHGFLDKVPAM
ncbi:nuclear transport factor 2 family protein [Saccharopolyspora pogona]|uniref:nuclear transport factor 2 family protein n=1 Tax=Saccharopolyspora pogona TaxID=333966 RepID=UPI001681E351|nr:nuclear transport factor 2 family protein [Saccharopolyspora pogona]